MKRAAVKIVPKLLNFEQKQRRIDITQEMLMIFKDDLDLLKKVITGNESWVYGYDFKTKAQSSQWKHTEEPKIENDTSSLTKPVKVLLTVFFDCNSVVHYEFLPQGRIVNKEYYLEVMSRLREAIRQKRTELWKNQSNKTVIMPQPPYSPDLTAAVFFLFSELKTPMRR